MDGGPEAARMPWPAEGLDRRWYFGVGPSQLHPSVPDGIRRALARGLPSWGHRSDAFRGEVAGTVEALREILEIPGEYRVLFLGSATEAMERVVQGVVGGEGPTSPRSFHLVNGAFARRFRTISRNLGGGPDGLEVEDGQGFRLSSVEVPDRFDLLAITQNETSTGVALDPGGIAALARRHSHLLSVVDVVTAAPVAPLELAAVDGVFLSVQKLFGLPAGLGVLVVSPRLVERVRERRRSGIPVGGHMHLPALADAADRNETGPTPNMLGIHLLGAVARDLMERGMGALRRDAMASAERIHQAASRAGWTPFPPRHEDRSRTVLVFRVPGPAGSTGERTRLRARGFEVSAGYGGLRDRLVRIGNFPSHPPEAVEGLSRAIEAGAGP
jgi:phosphoserine aminotransferase